jgi:predicted RNase H-like HicB family nuclease
MRKSIDYYMALPYTLEITPDTDDGGWVIEIKELEGCLTQADEWDEILPRIEEAKRLWLEVSLERGHAIPEPAQVVV